MHTKNKMEDGSNAQETSVPQDATITIPMSINNTPIEELLGSVTTYNNSDTENSKGLRTSARVIKKLKLDMVQSIPTQQDKEKDKKEVKEEVQVKKPAFRPLWSQEDKNLFFEALNDYGKDFDAIHLYISTKFKKKGLPESLVKTRDQIRHFYYRTWHKVCKHLKISDDIKKPAQELYALINYGEMRKKLGAVSEKTCFKLNELIYRGTVAIKSKGKTIRIKTPMCRALRRLNQLDENHDDLKLPTRVTIELRPKDMETWLYVQGLAQNPRVRIVLPLQRRVCNLINCMSARWKTQVAEAHNKLLNSANSALQNDFVPDIKISNEQKAILNPELRFSPPTDANVEIPTINLSEYWTSHRICLNAYEERVGVKIPGEVLWHASFKGGGKNSSRKGGTKRPRYESTGDKLSQNTHKNQLATDDPAAPGPSTSLVSPDASQNNQGSEIASTDPTNVNEVVEAAVNTILSLKNIKVEVSESLSSNINAAKEAAEKENEAARLVEEREEKLKQEMLALKTEQEIQRVKRGWTAESCGNLTVGELYLMFGTKSKIVLEYSWDKPVPPEEKTIKAEATNTDNNNTDNTVITKTNFEPSKSLSDTLQRLLSMAKLHYRKNMVHCPCGHVCGAPAKNKCQPNNKTLSTLNEKNADPNFNPEYTVGNPQQPNINQAPVNSTIFRTPILPAPSNEAFRQQLDSIQRMRPRFCNRRGRPRGKQQVVVERKLPLLPKPLLNGHAIVTMKMISHDAQQELRPKLRTIAPKTEQITHSSQKPGVPANLVSAPAVVEVSQNYIQEEGKELVLTESRAPSPTVSISKLLDLSDDMMAGTGNDTVTSFSGFLTQDIENATPPSSPSRILKENTADDNHWLNSEVADFSLSSFLGHLESPLKSQNVVAPDDGRLSQDVDAQLQSLLTENSIDYMAKFADLAAQVVSDTPKK